MPTPTLSPSVDDISPRLDEVLSVSPSPPSAASPPADDADDLNAFLDALPPQLDPAARLRARPRWWERDNHTRDELAALGVREAPHDVMLFDAWRIVHGRGTTHLSPELARVYESLAVRKSRALRRQTDEDRRVYAHRQAIRDAGGDPGPFIAPSRRARATKGGWGVPLPPEVETPEERRERLRRRVLQGDWPDPVRDAPAGGAAGRAARRLLWDELREMKALAREMEKELAEQRAVRQQLAKKLRAAERQNPTDRELRSRRVAAEGQARYMQPWRTRAIDDLVRVLARGRPVPRAERHPRAGVDLPARAHHWTGDERSW